ncbi:MAG: hypothetical protein V7637_1154 [Mycobacteriales bacterium]|jgi:hypothetical protein
MDVRLTAEQRALRDSAIQVVDALALKSVGQLDNAERVAKLDAAVAASGWREIRTANGNGEPLASSVEAALVAEELGRGVADTAYLGPTLAAELRRRAGAAASVANETVLLRADLSGPALASGNEVSGVAVDAHRSASALALAVDPAGYRLVAVDLGGAAPEVDLTRPVVRVEAQAVADVSGQRRGLTDGDLQAWSALALALTCADLVGTMRGAVELARSYATIRQQYGAPIGSFQAVQHRLADAFVSMEGSRSVALHAAWAVDALPPDDALGAGAVAKAYCSRAAMEACESAIQVHGGIGNTWECLAHVYLRRSLLSIQVLGGVGTNLTRVLARHDIGGDHGGLR